MDFIERTTPNKHLSTHEPGRCKSSSTPHVQFHPAHVLALTFRGSPQAAIGSLHALSLEGAFGSFGEPGAFGSSGGLGAFNSFGQPGAFGSSGRLGAFNSFGEPGAFGSSGGPGAFNSFGGPGAFNSSGGPGARRPGSGAERSHGVEGFGAPARSRRSRRGDPTRPKWT